MRIIKQRQAVLNGLPTCYACGAQKTTMEHVPPRVFFPADCDSGGENKYRRNLIKVPSCDKHNAEKSGDDVYALWHIAAQDGLNHCGQMMLKQLHRIADKDRAERQGLFVKRIESEIISWDESGRPLVKQDVKRMTDYLALVARGVYFSQRLEKLLVPLKVANVGNVRDKAREEELQKREDFFASEIGNSEVCGDNPEVFNFSICDRPGGVILIQLVFYGAAKCWVFYLPPKVDKPLVWMP